MSDYGNTFTTSKSRTNLKSPQSHAIDDGKSYKKKYELARDALKQEKKNGEQLQNRVKELQQIISKQVRQLQKKEQISEVLLDRIKCLKNALVEKQSKKGSQQTSYESKNNTKSNQSNNSHDDTSIKLQSPVGGYFGSIFK